MSNLDEQPKKRQKLVDDEAEESDDLEEELAEVDEKSGEDDEEEEDEASDDESDEEGNDQESRRKLKGRFEVFDEMKGFIVDEAEDSGKENLSAGEGEKDDDDDDEDDEAGPEQLDEDDLALIAENTGYTIGRLQGQTSELRGEKGSDEKSVLETDGLAGSAIDEQEKEKKDSDSSDVESGAGRRRLKKASDKRKNRVVKPASSGVVVGSTAEEVERNLFGNTEIADDEPSRVREGGTTDLALMKSGDSRDESRKQTDARGRRNESTDRRLTTLGFNSDSEDDWIEKEERSGWKSSFGGDEIWQQVHQIFGDCETVINILRNQKGEKVQSGNNDAETLTETSTSKLPAKTNEWEQLGEPDEVSREFLTASDDIIRGVDMPERLYQRYENRSIPASSAILDQEAGWISKRIFEEFSQSLKPDVLSDLYEKKFSGLLSCPDKIEQAVTVACRKCLEYLLVNHLEVCFICYHRSNTICPPLNEDMIWRIYELDLDWWRLYEISQGVLRQLDQLSKRGSKVNPLAFELASNFEQDVDLDDVKVYLMRTFATQLKAQEAETEVSNNTTTQTTEMAGENNTSTAIQLFNSPGDQPSSRPQLRRRRRHVALGLADIVEKYNMAQHWNEYFLHPDDVAKNLEALYIPPGKGREVMIHEGEPKVLCHVEKCLIETEKAQTVYNSRKFHLVDYYCRVCFIRDKNRTLRHSFASKPMMPPAAQQIVCKAPDGPSCLAVSEDTSNGGLCEILKAWCNKLREGPFVDGTKVFEGLVAHSARQLAAHPVIRQKIRTFYLENCSITTTTTLAGEKRLDIAKRNHIICRLLSLPIGDILYRVREVNTRNPHVSDRTHKHMQYSEGQDILRREETGGEGLAGELFIELLKAEKEQHIQIVFHPLGSEDERPWRVAGGRVNEKFLERHRNLKAQGKNSAQQEMAEFAHLDYRDSEIIRLLNEEVLSLCYCVDQKSNSAWYYLQSLILKRVVEKELFPLYRMEVRNLLSAKSQRAVLAYCTRALRWRLSQRPYKIDPDTVINRADSEVEMGEEASESSSSSSDSENVSNDEEEDDDMDEQELALKKRIQSRRRQKLRKERKRQIERPHISSEPVVLSFVLEDFNNGQRVHAVIVNRLGNIVIHTQLDYLLDSKKKRERAGSQSFEEKQYINDKNELLNLLREHNPDLLLIGLSHYGALDLYKVIKDDILTCTRKQPEDIFFCSLDVARIYVNSNNCVDALKEMYSSHAIMCSSLARLAQDPLAETVSLWGSKKQNYLLQLRLHHLQDMVGRDRLEQALLRAILPTVSHRGVNVNAMKSRPHLSSMLQFLPGFGPRKARDLLENLLGNSRLLVRGQLQLKPDAGSSSLAAMGDVVFRNCASFIIISDSNESVVDPLDSTRIHPENYSLAIKMCRHCQEDEDDAKLQDADDQTYVTDVLSNPKKLECLDLDEYAQMMKDVRMIPLFRQISHEFFAPYKLLNLTEFGGLHGESLFYEAYQEDPAEFSRLSAVEGRVTFARPNSVKCVVSPCGALASITDGECLGTNVQVGSLFRGRISRILPENITKFACDGHTPVLEIFCSERNQDNLIRDHCKHTLRRAGIDQQYLSSLYHYDKRYRILPRHTTDEQYELKSKTLAQTKRNIFHPSFKACTPSKAMAYLASSQIPVGEAIFRATTKHDRLSLLIKTSQTPLNVLIYPVEETKQPVPGELGKELWIQGRKFEDLDQVISQFTEKLRVNLEEILSSPKYVEEVRLGEVLKMLQNRRLSKGDGETIEYCFIPPNPNVLDDQGRSRQADAPNRFCLVAVIPTAREHYSHRSTIRHVADGVYVNPDYFQIWQTQHRSLKALLNWWKTEGFKNRNVYLRKHSQTKQAKQVNGSQRGM